MGDTPKPRLGIIRAGESYPLSIFSRLAGLGPAALRSARRQGLRVCQGGGRRWVLGRDWIDYLDRTNPSAGSLTEGRDDVDAAGAVSGEGSPRDF